MHKTEIKPIMTLCKQQKLNANGNNRDEGSAKNYWKNILLKQRALHKKGIS